HRQRRGPGRRSRPLSQKETGPRRERPREAVFEIQTQRVDWRRRTSVEGNLPPVRDCRWSGVVHHRIRKRRLSAPRQRGENARSHAALGKVLTLARRRPRREASAWASLRLIPDVARPSLFTLRLAEMLRT